MTHTGATIASSLRNLLIVLVGQVGCITLAVILISVRVGQWLDAYFQTRPLYTLLAASLPAFHCRAADAGGGTTQRWFGYSREGTGNKDPS